MSARPEKRKRLIVLDTHAIIHRAYHALPDFATSKGEPTGALYGLIAMLLKSLEDLKPDMIIAARDLPGGTHRHEAYDGYKATRKDADDALIAQLEAAPQVFAAFGIPLYEAPGFEADDCIGTLVERFKHSYDVVIVSGDMDTLQLVDDHVRVYTLKKGLNDTVLYDRDRVRERYGFGPEHVVDYKALRGDPSDNIPGIRGIGEKTAETLVSEIGSLDEIYATLRKNRATLEEAGIKKRIIDLLENGQKDAEFSKELATIRRDAPLSVEVPVPWALAAHAESIVALCDKYEFRSLRERVKALLKKRAAETPVHASLFGDPDETEAEADPALLIETSIALWLLRSEMTTPSLADILSYARARDLASASRAIFEELGKTGRLKEVYERIEKPLIPIVERMREVGVALDVPYLRALSREYGADLSAIAASIHAHAGHEFNISSPKQLGVVLFDELKLVLPRQKKTAGGARTTREEELVKLADQHPIIGEVLRYRELQKLLSTYIDKMADLVGEDGRLHPQFLQAGSATGRMASQNPGVQNIPIRTEHGRRIRNAFIAAPGFVLSSIDYSQIELRIAAGLSGDERLVRVFKEGGDIHTAVAAAMFHVSPVAVDKEMRRRAKVINFGILYGMGVNALRQNLGDVSREEAARFLEDYFTQYPELTQYLETTKSEAARLGYTETLFGRRRYFTGFKSALPSLRAQAERMAVNAPIQGTQADIIKLAMIEADRLIEERGWREDVRLLLQVHDELVYEIRSEMAEPVAREMKRVMESVAPIEKLSGVPIIAEASLGESWGAMRRLSA
jgi:DNA polymerase-1